MKYPTLAAISRDVRASATSFGISSEARTFSGDARVSIGFDDPMYMIVNLAMGSKNFEGVGFVDGESPNLVEFEIDRISAYQIDTY